MDSRERTIRQQMAILGARQGDPDSPASGTLFARRLRLHSELESISREAPASAPSSVVETDTVASLLATSRSVHAVRRDIAAVDAEILALQRRLSELDQILNGAPRKGRK